VFEDARARLARADARTRDRGRANDGKESFAAGGRAMREVARSRDERRAIARAPRGRAVDWGWDARREGLTNARSRARAQVQFRARPTKAFAARPVQCSAVKFSVNAAAVRASEAKANLGV